MTIAPMRTRSRSSALQLPKGATTTHGILENNSTPPPPSSKRVRRNDDPGMIVTPPTSIPPSNHAAFQQWQEDVSNVDISVAVSFGGRGGSGDVDDTASTCATSSLLTDRDVLVGGGGLMSNSNNQVHAEFSVCVPAMLSRLIQQKLAIEPCRMSTSVIGESAEAFVTVSVKGRDEQIAEAIEGGLTPRKAFLRSAPHISRVASRLQECMRQMFGMRDFVVRVD